MPSPRRRVPPWTVAAAFALTPWVTLGFGTPFAFAAMAFALRSWWFGAAAVGYGAALVVEFATSGSVEGTTADTVFNWALALVMVGGGLHAALLSRRVNRALAGTPAGTDELIASVSASERAAITNDPTLRRALGRRERRRRAREIVQTDPALADELGIGRIDRHRAFDDGGLVDVNRVAAQVLAELPGFTAAMADGVVSARDRLEGLSSTADLIVYADVPPEVAERLAPRLLFRPL
jgi:hypothetical protein